MFDFLNMALMGLNDPMKLATTMASQNIAPQVMQQGIGIGAMAQPAASAMQAGGNIPMPSMSMGVPMAPGAGAQPIGAQASGPGTQVASLDNSIFDEFMNTVNSGVTSPFGRAAVAATGLRESGFSTGNSFRTWNDRSQSGKNAPSGGIMSWRAERLDALHQFAGTKDMKQIAPGTQGAFFLQENPDLIAKLNAAGSNSEAMALMNDHWQFAGFDDPNSDEFKQRFAAVERVGPLFAASANSPAPGPLQSRSLSGVDIPQQTQPEGISQIAGEFGSDGTGAAMTGDGATTTKPQTLAEKLAAIGKGLKVPENKGSGQEMPRIAGGSPNFGGGFGRNPQSIEQLFAMLGGNAPAQSQVPSLSQLMKGV